MSTDHITKNQLPQLDALRENSKIIKDNISLAQWALVDEIRSGKWKNLDFPRIAREDFNLDGIEFVNTLFEIPTEEYLKRLKKNASDHGVEMVLIMVDEEGDACVEAKKERQQFAINHRKWVDIAHYLGCGSIRTNCRGYGITNKTEGLEFATDSYHLLLDYASGSGVNILIENHGGLSNDPEWMVALMKKISHPRLGIYPDWRSPGIDFDNYGFLQKTLPYSKGMSYRNQPEDELTIRMIQMTRDAGYKGWWGIESDGRAEINKGIQLLKKYVINS